MASYQQKRMLEDLMKTCEIDETKAKKILRQSKWNFEKAREIVEKVEAEATGKRGGGGEGGRGMPHVEEATEKLAAATATPSGHRGLLLVLRSMIWENLLFIVVWALLFAFFLYCEFGAVFSIVSGIFFLFWCTGTREKGEKSAYSVFNRNCESITGSFESRKMDSFAMWG
jgi:hypothetical protein